MSTRTATRAAGPRPHRRAQRTLLRGVARDERGFDGTMLVTVDDKPYTIELFVGGRAIRFRRGHGWSGTESIVSIHHGPCAECGDAHAGASCTCRGWAAEWDCVHLRMAVALGLICRSHGLALDRFTALDPAVPEDLDDIHELAEDPSIAEDLAYAAELAEIRAEEESMNQVEELVQELEDEEYEAMSEETEDAEMEAFVETLREADGQMRLFTEGQPGAYDFRRHERGPADEPHAQHRPDPGLRVGASRGRGGRERLLRRLPRSQAEVEGRDRRDGQASGAQADRMLQESLPDTDRHPLFDRSAEPAEPAERGRPGRRSARRGGPAR
ncbi:MAG: hypothetical protein U0800_13185 [Isosphaeraceae bacterium]